MPIIGPKLSLVGLILSVWGIVQLFLMGVFFYVEAVALIEDIPLEEVYYSSDEIMRDITRGYAQNAYNCWIATCMYIVLFVFTLWQFLANKRSTYQS